MDSVNWSQLVNQCKKIGRTESSDWFTDVIKNWSSDQQQGQPEIGHSNYRDQLCHLTKFDQFWPTLTNILLSVYQTYDI